MQTEKGPVCDTKTFEITGDVTVDKVGLVDTLILRSLLLPFVVQ